VEEPSSMNPPPNTAPRAKEEIKISEKSIDAACRRGDARQLRKWGRQGVHIRIGDTL
jgi:hypothetical protein